MSAFLSTLFQKNINPKHALPSSWKFISFPLKSNEIHITFYSLTQLMVSLSGLRFTHSFKEAYFWTQILGAVSFKIRGTSGPGYFFS